MNTRFPRSPLGPILCWLLCACAGGTDMGDTAGELARHLREKAPDSRDQALDRGEIPGAPDYPSLAKVLMARGFFDVALAELERAAFSGLDTAELHCLKGGCLREKGDWDQAAAEFEAALRRDPDMAAAHAGLGAVAVLKGDAASAVRRYEEAVRRDPAAAAFLNNLAVALMAENRMAEAITRLQRAIAIAPDFRRAWNNLGMAYALSGRDEEALEAFRAGGDEKKAAANLAFVRWRSGREKTERPPSPR